ncbi:MAG: DUF5010 domain-containing protein [Planctomycetota bacterium]|nr:DUF5010 domain-containing protein [Planctomycetota bacterium]
MHRPFDPTSSGFTRALLASVCAMLAMQCWLSSAEKFPEPPGKYVPLDAEHAKETRTFSSDQKIVAAYYFYWYDSKSKAHIVDGDGSDALQDHPATMDGFSYALPAWHKKEICDLTAAGIDIALPVYWGTPGGWEGWSNQGLACLATALEELENEGKPVPAIGMFYDTTTLSFVTKHQPNKDGADLTTEDGKELFYCTMRDFFSLIPPRFWAQIDGKPVVWLYSAGWCSAFDRSAFEHLDRRFKEDFQGKTPYVVREVSWNRPFRKGGGVPVSDAKIATDNSYQWGAALAGPLIHGVAAIGPGYNDSAVPGRTTPIRDREDGGFYERSWFAALKSKRKIVVVETWNELHEGTDICETKEYGRKYVELTAKYVQHFKKGTTPPKPEGRYTDANQVRVEFGKDREIPDGLQLVRCEDGLTELNETGEGWALRSCKNKFGDWRYIYFAVDDSFAFFEDETFTVVLEVAAYWDCGFTIQYDSNDASAPLDGAYKDGPRSKAGPGFSEVRLELDRACFSNRQNGGADFRIAVAGYDLFVRKISLLRVSQPR